LREIFKGLEREEGLKADNKEKVKAETFGKDS
jgi:hypothetical protein